MVRNEGDHSALSSAWPRTSHQHLIRFGTRPACARALGVQRVESGAKFADRKSANGFTDGVSEHSRFAHLARTGLDGVSQERAGWHTERTRDGNAIGGAGCA